MVAIHRSDKPLRCIDSRKRIYFSDINNLTYIVKIIRNCLIQRHNLLEIGNTERDKKEKIIKTFEE